MKKLILILLFISLYSAKSEYKWTTIDSITASSESNVSMSYDMNNTIYLNLHGFIEYSKDDGINWFQLNNNSTIEDRILDIACGKNFLIYSKKDSIIKTYDYNQSKSCLYVHKDSLENFVANLHIKNDTIIFENSAYYTYSDSIIRTLYYSTNLEGPYKKSMSTRDSIASDLFPNGTKGPEKLLFDKKNNYFFYTQYRGIFHIANLADGKYTQIFTYFIWDHFNDINIYQDTILMSLHDNRIMYTSDCGKTWILWYNQPFFIRAFAVHKNKIAVATYDTLYLTTDFGNSWEVIASGIYTQSPSKIFFSKKGTIFLYQPWFKFSRGVEISDAVIDYSFKNNINLNPNPADDYIEINLDRCTPSGRWSTSGSEIKIYDVLGNVVLSTGTSFLRKQVSSEQRSSSPGNADEIPDQVGNDSQDIRLDVSGLAAGVYFVRVGGQVLKFVKL